ncbi:MAG TPA: branched-chain amino acid ABC transporter permease, partial [Clostridia bacterium]|nr:branched-chain amino acid ABC transporter permease [Clostridia bacterium]
MKKKVRAELWVALIAIALIYVLIAVLEQTMDANHIIFTVLKKGAIYSLVAVSMNLLNGFTGLFSLGQAGFMLIGAYTYAIFTMPTEVKLTESVYKYYEAAVKFDTGIFVGLLCAGLAAALFAALIGLPVLRLKSDYLAIATIGFAEIIRAILQW